MIVAICLGLIVGTAFGFFLGLDWGMEQVEYRPILIPQVVRREPDRILKTVFTPQSYNPGRGWTYHPEVKEWWRET